MNDRALAAAFALRREIEPPWDSTSCLRDGEPQSESREAPRAADIGLAEFLEDVRQEFGGDAFAAVAHLAADRVAVDAA